MDKLTKGMNLDRGKTRYKDWSLGTSEFRCQVDKEGVHIQGPRRRGNEIGRRTEDQQRKQLSKAKRGQTYQMLPMA